jgi:uncharacterized protein YyaL (SSP411 family)
MVEEKRKDFGNQLAREKSPYLLQHADNPVHWLPWGDDAFEKAKAEDKPIFLSVGYATCHWCHVMAHESFEDDEVAEIINKHFISVKVDREERPDVDKIYMSVCQALTGRGGWPLTVLMTPDGKPFFAGSYFPKTSHMGMPGLMDILNQLAAMWQEDRDRILTSGDKITAAIQPQPVGNPSAPLPGQETLKKAFSQLSQNFDARWGGFGKAPKFPSPHNFTFLLRYHQRDNGATALEMVEKTLDAMRNGGIFDQVGLGFHRYSVDDQWLVPHFEKMLYDQALLAMAYTECYQVTRKDRFGRVAQEIFTYVLRDMTDPKGGFYSAEDADSEGEEGLFYVWTPGEVKACLGNNPGDLFCRFFNITDNGNFEGGKSIPHMTLSPGAFADKEGINPQRLLDTLENARVNLFNVRENRIHPLKDDKIITSWNGLMIAALAKGAQALDEPLYAKAAEKAAGFILENLVSTNGRLLRRYREQEAALPAYLNDYAFMVWGLLELYEATFNVSWFEKAILLNREMIDIFWDDLNGGLFYTGKGNERLITRSKEIYDGALPSGNSVAALNFLRLNRMTGDMDLAEKLDQLLGTFAEQVTHYPMAHTQFLAAVDFVVGPSREIVIAGNPELDATLAMRKKIQERFLPNKVVLFRPDEGSAADKCIDLAPFLKDIPYQEQAPTVYVCEQYACKAPVTTLEDLEATLKLKPSSRL